MFVLNIDLILNESNVAVYQVLYFFVIKINKTSVVIILILETVFFSHGVVLSLPVWMVHVVLFFQILTDIEGHSALLWENFMRCVVNMEVIVEKAILWEGISIIESEVTPHPSRVYCMGLLVSYDDLLSEDFICELWVHKHEGLLLRVRESYKSALVLRIEVVGLCVVVIGIVHLFKDFVAFGGRYRIC